MNEKSTLRKNANDYLTHTKIQKGITLIALVITIIILIILAGVAINMTLGENGIFNKAKQAKEQYKMAEVKEKVELTIAEIQTDKMSKGEKCTIDTIISELPGKLSGLTISKDGENAKGTYNGCDFTITPDLKVAVDGYNPSTGGSSEENTPQTPPTPTTYSVTFNGTNVTSNGESTANENETYTATLAVTTGYTISSVTVTMGGTTLVENTEYTYSEGNLSIPNVSGNIAITAIGVNQTPQISNPITTARTGNNLDAAPYNYSWDEIEALAKAISDDNRNTITYTTTQVTITMDGKEYTIGVGDYKNVTYGGTNKQVRILGFNHDILADLEDTTANSTNHYGGNNTYAGISFEFVDFIITSAQMNSEVTNVGGWASCPLRKNTLKSATTLNNISIGSKIKEVTKTYNTGNRGTTNATCNDKLWLLACSEIWQNGYSSYGYCNTKEGEQYAYYRVNTGSTAYNNRSQTATRKPSTSSKSHWWLRSPHFGNKSHFCIGSMVGICEKDFSNNSNGVAPGFSI